MGTIRIRPPIGPAIHAAIYREVFWAADFEPEVLDRIAEAAANAVREVLREYGVVN